MLYNIKKAHFHTIKRAKSTIETIGNIDSGNAKNITRRNIFSFLFGR